MEALNGVLPILLYIVAIVLIVMLIVISFKLIRILDKVDKIVDDVNEKVSSFDSAIAVLSKAADGFASISNSIMTGIMGIVTKVFKKNENKEED